MLHETTDTRPSSNGVLPLGLRSSPVTDGTECSHILIPTALTRREHSAVMLGLQMAAALNAQATLLHIVPIAEQTNSLHWLDAIERLQRTMLHPSGEPPALDRLTILEQSRAKVVTYLEREVPQHLRSRTRMRVECCLGDVADEILRFAAAESVDLVILSSGLSRWWLPVVPARVHRVLRQLRNRVIVVRQDKADRPARIPQRRRP